MTRPSPQALGSAALDFPESVRARLGLAATAREQALHRLAADRRADRRLDQRPERPLGVGRAEGVAAEGLGAVVEVILGRRRQLDELAVAGHHQRLVLGPCQRVAPARALPARAGHSPRRHRAEADLDAPDPSRREPRHPLDRRGPSQVQPRPERADEPAVPLQESDLVRTDRRPARRRIGEDRRDDPQRRDRPPATDQTPPDRFEVDLLVPSPDRPPERPTIPRPGAVYRQSPPTPRRRIALSRTRNDPA